MSAQADRVLPAARSTSSFYSFLALLFVLIAFGGFARTYLLPVATGRFDGAAILHVHGALFLAWTLLFAVQTRFAASGRIDLHRAAGMLGISLATAMVFTGLTLVVRGLSYAAAVDNEAAARALAIVPTSQIMMFAVFFTVAVMSIRRPESHKRLMLLATIALLTAPVARLFLTLFGADEALPGALPNFGAVSDPVLPLFGALMAGLLVDLLVVAAMVRDWRLRGRPHRVYVIGGLCILLVQLLRVPAARTDAWHSVAATLESLGIA